jgi:hypothetical protein
MTNEDLPETVPTLVFADARQSSFMRRLHKSPEVMTLLVHGWKLRQNAECTTSTDKFRKL